MAKLSAAQDKAIRGLSKGEFPLGTNKRTIDALVKSGYVVEDNTFYDLTVTGREYLGIDESIGEITALLDSNPSDNVTAELNGDAMPFVVQELKPFVGWVTLPETRARTWGTANVRRNRMTARGMSVRVHNIITDQVWA